MLAISLLSISVSYAFVPDAEAEDFLLAFGYTLLACSIIGFAIAYFRGHRQKQV